MCIFGGGNPAPPPAPAPLPPPPPVPPAPPAPLPTPQPMDVSQVNPQIRRAKRTTTKKASGEFATGTSQLRVPLGSKVNTGQSTPKGGLNQ